MALGLAADSEHAYPPGTFLEKRRRADASEAGGVLWMLRPVSEWQAEREEFRRKRRIMGAAETELL